MENVIIYGLGQRFQENRAWLEREYNVLGYRDKDSAKLKLVAKAIELKDLPVWQSEADKILITPYNPWEIIENLQKKYGVDINKLELLVPQDTVDMGKALPEQQFFAPYNEDALILLLLNKLGLNSHEIKYLEYGVDSILAGSFSYYFYRAGSRGVLVGNMSNQVLASGKIFRHEDVMRAYDDYGSFLECLSENSACDLLIVHDRSALAFLYEYILSNTRLPRIIYADNNTEQYMTFMLTHDYCWYATTDNGMIFYRKEND